MTKAKASHTRTSLRAFAREMGTSHTAVVKAVRAGRLRRSLGRDARGPFIGDLAAARREWTQERARATPAKAPAAKRPGKSAEGLSLTDVQKRVGVARAVSLEIANRVKRGELLDAAKEKRRDFEIARTVRDNLLNIADRLSPEIAAETDAGKVHARLDEEIRKALGSLAKELDELQEKHDDEDRKESQGDEASGADGGERRRTAPRGHRAR